jgi:folate-binding protein YgfZ
MVRVRGKDRLDFLHRLSTNEIQGLRPGEGTFTVLLNTKGRVLDLVHALEDGSELQLVTSPEAGGKIGAWLDGYIFREEVTLEAAGVLPCLGLYGPASEAILEKTAGGKWETLPLAHHRSIKIAGSPARAARTLPLGGGGYLLMGDPGTHLVAWWEDLVAAGAVPAGSDALESLRVATGVPAWGKELTEDYNPWEAGLDAAVSLTKGCYLGQEIVARLHNYRKVQRRLAGIRLEGPPPPERSSVFAGGEEIGFITSAATSPFSGGSVALGILGARHIQPDLPVTVAGHEAESRGFVVPLPSLGIPPAGLTA